MITITIVPALSFLCPEHPRTDVHPNEISKKFDRREERKIRHEGVMDSNNVL